MTVCILFCYQPKLTIFDFACMQIILAWSTITIWSTALYRSIPQMQKRFMYRCN